MHSRCVPGLFLGTTVDLDMESRIVIVDKCTVPCSVLIRLDSISALTFYNRIPIGYVQLNYYDHIRPLRNESIATATRHSHLHTAQARKKSLRHNIIVARVRCRRAWHGIPLPECLAKTFGPRNTAKQPWDLIWL